MNNATNVITVIVLLDGFRDILGQKSNGPLQTMDVKMPPVRPIFINRISHSSAASAQQY